MVQQSISRVYRSRLRQQQAAQTRSKVVAAAAELFASQGYARTTFAKIATAAGVSAETVQAHGPKAALLRAAFEYVAFGITDQDSVFDLELGRGLLAINDRDEAISYLVAAATDMYGRGVSLIMALAGAATVDPELGRYYADVVADVTLQNRRLLAVCRDRGWIRDDIPIDDIVETTAVLFSAETYHRIVHHDGMTVDTYRRWLRRMLDETVFQHG
ncbi:helix-turn-helix domain-containing protein [Mycobacterium sp.]|uniref:TetR/AcrR family transcriptional regulator n=1 Tax=Mycobacterium sp. TaxID=1785 RepID=UPI002B613749|nr:helix-turn-helix domain-containing protein [Mycobacterium sp.]HKP41715.1 helix-turn-helix domain-containing protein [Mycobacterium sp.]